MSKIGQKSMKKMAVFATSVQLMVGYGLERSFLLIFSARDGKSFIKIGLWEVSKPSYLPLLRPAE